MCRRQWDLVDTDHLRYKVSALVLVMLICIVLSSYYKMMIFSSLME